jgi:hypothetical protein
MQVFNQLSSGIFRNMPCPCKSGKKIKNCCGINKIVDNSEMESIRGKIKKAQEDFIKETIEKQKEEGMNE